MDQLYTATVANYLYLLKLYKTIAVLDPAPGGSFPRSGNAIEEKSRLIGAHANISRPFVKKRGISGTGGAT